jgi:hypothetical protein
MLELAKLDEERVDLKPFILHEQLLPVDLMLRFLQGLVLLLQLLLPLR